MFEKEGETNKIIPFELGRRASSRANFDAGNKHNFRLIDSMF